MRGAKHQYYCPNEIPGYSPTKQYNPHQHMQRRFTHMLDDNDSFFLS